MAQIPREGLHTARVTHIRGLVRGLQQQSGATSNLTSELAACSGLTQNVLRSWQMSSNRSHRYVVVECGYEDRLELEPLEQLDTADGSSDNKFLYVSHGDKVRLTSSKKRRPVAEELIREIEKGDGVVFTWDGQTGSAMRIADELMEFGHCGCFTHNNLVRVEMITVVNLDMDVLNLEYDTESG